MKKECKLTPIITSYSYDCIPCAQLYLEELTQTVYMAIHEHRGENRMGYNASSIIAVAPLFDPEDRSKALSYDRYLELCQ